MEIRSSNSLESSVYKDALALRKEVFVMEQGVSLEPTNLPVLMLVFVLSYFNV